MQHYISLITGSTIKTFLNSRPLGKKQ
jgi:hypothetical protein